MKRRARIVALRAYVVAGAGADYHDQAEGHRIDGQIATPMARYADYRAYAGRTRRRFVPLVY